MANKRRPTRQWGGTFLGIVLGLIVGLAVAVVVALYITKTPAPFVEKVPPRPAENSPAAQAPDPNKALQSRTPLPNAAPLGTAAEPVSPPPAAMPSVPGVPGVPAEPSQAATPPAKSSPADILNGKTADAGNRSAAKPTVPSAPLPPPSAAASDDAKTGYFLQVGAYKLQTDAEQQRAKLALQGFEARVTQRDANGLVLYRVRMGPYNKLDEMTQIRQRLQDMGVDTAVIRFTKP